MSERFPMDGVPNINGIQSHPDGRQQETNIETAQGLLAGVLSPPAAPPIITTNNVTITDPSSLTMPSTNTNSQNVSVRRAEYDVTGSGVVLSVPVTTEAPCSNSNRNQTYQEGYDSNGEASSFFDAIASQLDDDDEVYDEEEHAPIHETPTTEKNQQQESEVPAAANLTDFHLMTVAFLKEELRKRNLSVNGRKDVLLQHLLAPRVTTSSLGQREQREQPANMTGFALSKKWHEVKCNEQRVSEKYVQHLNLVGPTVPTEEAEAPKYNFDEVFDRPPFTAVSPIVKHTSRGKPVSHRQGKLV